MDKTKWVCGSLQNRCAHFANTYDNALALEIDASQTHNLMGCTKNQSQKIQLLLFVVSRNNWNTYNLYGRVSTGFALFSCGIFIHSIATARTNQISLFCRQTNYRRIFVLSNAIEYNVQFIKNIKFFAFICCLSNTVCSVWRFRAVHWPKPCEVIRVSVL